jgi:hypothetical protein
MWFFCTGLYYLKIAVRKSTEAVSAALNKGYTVVIAAEGGSIMMTLRINASRKTHGHAAAYTLYTLWLSTLLNV